MKKLKKLPILLALMVTLFVSACTEIEVDPRTDGDREPEPIIVPPTKSQTTSSDTTSIG